MRFSSLTISALNARMPWAVFSVAMAFSLSMKRNAFSSRVIFSWSLAAADASLSFSTTGVSVFCNSSRRSGLMVSRSQPASSMICPELRNDAPMTSVL